MAQNPFGDIPLFREIQRILESSEGPVNYEIARQVAAAVVAGKPEGRPDPAIARAFDDSVHIAAGALSGYTRIPLDEPMLTAVITRAEWASGTLSAWKWLFDHLGGRLAGEMGGRDEGEAGAMQMALSQVGPLLFGMQAGTLTGNLALEALSRYDLPIPRDDDGRLFVVAGNVVAVAADYGFDLETFVRWLGVSEAARGIVAAGVSWVPRYARSLLLEIVDSIEIDIADLERRMTELQSRGVEALQEGIGPEGALPVVHTERHRRALDRLHSFHALFEGYARHVRGAVSDELIGDTTLIDEGVTRHHASPSDGEELLASMLGLSLDRSLETAGETFCAAVVEIKGVTALARVWDAPDNLPTLAEIRDPFSWMERVLDE